MSIQISKIATYLPETILDNQELSKEQEDSISAEEIFKRTGIRKRYIAGENQTASDMAVEVGEKILKDNTVDRNEIDFLIFCSECFDFIAPTNACIIQDRLQLRNDIGAIDLPYGCSGYIYGLALSNALISSGMVKKVLFITSDTSTKVIHKENYELRSLFSDIATANIIEKANNVEAQKFEFGTDGSGYQNLIVDYSGFRNKSANPNPIDLPNGELKMKSTEIFRFGIKEVPLMVKKLLAESGKEIADIDLFIFHQASFYLLEIIRRKIKAPKEKFFINLENFGNSVSSTIPVALNEAARAGVLKKGMTIMICGFGIGHSWGGTIMKY